MTEPTWLTEAAEAARNASCNHTWADDDPQACIPCRLLAAAPIIRRAVRNDMADEIDRLFRHGAPFQIADWLRDLDEPNEPLHRVTTEQSFCCEAGAVAYPDRCPWHGVEEVDHGR